MPNPQAVDIWSLGCILAELLSGNVLLQVMTPSQSGVQVFNWMAEMAGLPCRIVCCHVPILSRTPGTCTTRGWRACRRTTCLKIALRALLTVSVCCAPQNSGLASLLARMEGILGSVPGWMRARGRYAHRFYTRAGALYRHSPRTVRPGSSIALAVFSQPPKVEACAESVCGLASTPTTGCCCEQL